MLNTFLSILLFHFSYLGLHRREVEVMSLKARNKLPSIWVSISVYFYQSQLVHILKTFTDPTKLDLLSLNGYSFWLQQ